MAGEETRRKLAAIMSADVAGYSRLMGDDEAATVATLREYRGAIARVVARHQGRVVNAPGDNILAEFPSAVEAVQAACEIQQVLKGRNLELAPDRRMEFRIGVNLGDVIEEEDGSIYGDGVNIAARMEALAEAGGICIASSIYDAVEGKVDFGFDFQGAQKVKNIDKPVNVYRVRSDGGRRPRPRRRAPGSASSPASAWRWASPSAASRRGCRSIGPDPRRAKPRPRRHRPPRHPARRPPINICWSATWSISAASRRESAAYTARPRSIRRTGSTKTAASTAG